MSVRDMDDRLILVDAEDTPIGECGKMQAHREGLLHRAFSIFVFDGAGRLLLQRRAASKYHSGALWSNTCCGHPRPGEALPDSARRRLREEMGFACVLQKVDTLLYRASFGNGLIEHEFVHIHAGRFDGPITSDPAEAAEWCWTDMPTLFEWIAREPDAFTVWFRLMVERASTHGLQEWSSRVCLEGHRGAADAVRPYG